MGSVSTFGAVAPTSMPSSRPTPDTVTAILGSESLLQASLRITVLMTRSIGPVGPRPSRGPYVLSRPTCPAVPDRPICPAVLDPLTCPADPGGAAESGDTFVTRGIPPLDGPR